MRVIAFLAAMLCGYAAWLSACVLPMSYGGLGALLFGLFFAMIISSIGLFALYCALSEDLM